MQAWFESIAGPDYASALMWTIFALIGLLVLLIFIRIVRGLTFGTFVAGGRNRKARLAVMDATAVDSHRRLILVRRDDVEHLILIGGPSDVVVEQNIRLLPPTRRPAGEDPLPMQEPTPVVERTRPPEQAVARPAPTPPPAAPTPPPRQPAPQPQPYVPPVVARPTPAAPVVQPASPVSPVAPSVRQQPQEPRFSSFAPAQTAPAVVAPVVAASHAITTQTRTEPIVSAVHDTRSQVATTRDPHDLDDTLLEELQASLDNDQRKPEPDDVDASLDEEMSRLLGDLSGPHR
ncbi:hypothetical protein [Mesorhizobium sp. CAU 1732]|uniref:hypothetical protein n=1 Tax=Mesorhizobium sp. CAU 1732 TaxID=3140358 RepID=UPI00326147D4